ncbi:hypothetical protein ACM74C_08050 [Pseudomonas aeruginosa]
MRYFDRSTRSEALPGIHLIDSPSVVALPDDHPYFAPLAPGMTVDFDADGLPVIVASAPLTEDQLIGEYTVAVQLEMDQRARLFGYDDIKTAVTYAEEPSVARFQDEGRAFRAWRSACWDHCYTLLATVKAGERELPSVAQLLAELPELGLQHG